MFLALVSVCTLHLHLIWFWALQMYQKENLITGARTFPRLTYPRLAVTQNAITQKDKTQTALNLDCL